MPSPRKTTALAHPIWSAALILLIANDHLLKNLPQLPELLTGKLSDMAGLIVAPILLAAVLGAKRPAARAAAFALVAVPFVAMKISPPFAALLERLSASVGVPWSILPD